MRSPTSFESRHQQAHCKAKTSPTLNFRELRKAEVRRIYLLGTKVNKPVHAFCPPLVTASSDKNHPFGGCAGCLWLLAFQDSAKKENEIVGQIAEPRKGTLLLLLLNLRTL